MSRRDLWVFILGALLLGSAWLAADIYLFLTHPVLDAGASKIFRIESGASFHEIARDLEKHDLLSRSVYWTLLARLQGKARSIKAGEYNLQGPLTPQLLLERLVSGKTRQFSLTLVEGWTFRQVLDALARHPQIKKTLSNTEDVMALLGKPGMHPEGWFFPDTYHFPRGTTDLNFLRRSHEVMRQRLRALWKTRDSGLPLARPYQALILASIVEKETAIPEERPLIAAVFMARLKKGMRLQTDPTVVYGLGSRYNGDIRYRDLRQDTRYNTYVHKGLPPTPIGMPSEDSLEAVLRPAATDALYFVAKRDGHHQFSVTYEEHREAVIKYQLSDGNTQQKTSDK